MKEELQAACPCSRMLAACRLEIGQAREPCCLCCRVLSCRAALVLGLSRQFMLTHARLGNLGKCNKADLQASCQPCCKADHG